MAQDLMSLIHEAGFTGDAANTMYGIVMAESGGNANAHNTNASTGDNSYGLAQINMLGDLGPQRLQQFGLSSADQLFDPLTNLRVAYQLSGGGQNFTPWSTYNSGAYLNQAPGAVVQASATSNPYNGGTTGSSLTQPTETQAQKKAELEQGVGPLGALLTSVPELAGLLSQAITQGWSLPELQNAVTNSNWYRTHSDTVRNAIALQVSDPKTWEQNLNKEIVRVQQMELQLGVRMNHDAMAQLATQSLMVGGWDQQTLQDQVGQLWSRTNGSNLNVQSGQAAATGQQIRQIASDYGLPVTNYGVRFWTEKILSGQDTIDGNKQAAIAQAKTMYAPFAKQIDAGQTMRQIADPYVASMANLLELNPESINFASDPLIKKALQGTGVTASGQEPTATPLWQFEQQVRSDPRWDRTLNAKQATAQALTDLGKDWGFAS